MHSTQHSYTELPNQKEIKNEVIHEWQTTFDGQSTGVVKEARCTIDVKKVKVYGIMKSFPRSAVSTLVQYRSGLALVGSWVRMCRVPEEVYSYDWGCGDNKIIHHITIEIDFPIREILRLGLTAISDIMDLSVPLDMTSRLKAMAEFIQNMPKHSKK
ncbi:hypothetical protein TRICI_004372 [Trichomonascus ciferrii]|uniref:Uncharacterized protein n=1 Tax=Trichomonascus ciferrii TaxID=44093 RepID=A0A642V616_9ASCO|nr:hypothetical protein TRICI_004372 [Trichomonascus ciferrii]